MMPEFLVQECDRCYRQIENILIERAKVGEKPFNPEFYEKAPLVKGLNEAEEVVVVVLDSPIGDSVVTVPAVIALDRYFQENKIADKKIKVVASAGQMGLLKSLEEQYQGRLELVNMDKMQEYFSKQGDKKRFVINTHKSFQDYKTLGISDQEAKDLSRVMSVTWDSWLKEEVPQSKDRMHQYYPIPMRIMRNFEVMLGQKLFKDIRNIDHFLEKSKNFEQEAKELREKYKIPEGEDIVVISAGAGVTPKEYKPEHWREVITGICEKYPDTRILFIDDPRPKKQEIYGKMVDDQLVAEKKYKVTRVNEGLDKMNTIMSMSKFSITPDTGLGHYSAALGVPNIMLILGDPVQWSEKQTVRIMHPQSHRVYGEGKGIFHEAWAQPDDYYVTMKDGSKVGASDIKPAEILKEVDKLMEKKI